MASNCSCFFSPQIPIRLKIVMSHACSMNVCVCMMQCKMFLPPLTWHSIPFLSIFRCFSLKFVLVRYIARMRYFLNNKRNLIHSQNSLSSCVPARLSTLFGSLSQNSATQTVENGSSALHCMFCDAVVRIQVAAAAAVPCSLIRKSSTLWWINCIFMHFMQIEQGAMCAQTKVVLMFHKK